MGVLPVLSFCLFTSVSNIFRVWFLSFDACRKHISIIQNKCQKHIGYNFPRKLILMNTKKRSSVGRSWKTDYERTAMRGKILGIMVLNQQRYGSLSGQWNLFSNLQQQFVNFFQKMKLHCWKKDEVEKKACICWSLNRHREWKVVDTANKSEGPGKWM